MEDTKPTRPTRRKAAAAKPATTVAKPATKILKPAATAAKSAEEGAKASAGKAANAPARKAAPSGSAPKSVGGMDPELRGRMIETAAYFRAERRGFAPGYEVEDWFASEVEIDALLSSAASQRATPAKKQGR